ncbi:extracellular calcium-sensing receptor-like [Ambystoma mexicanum]|uniref:extracellular calcium-sensing receptor-like n=1 Tax=Ambystoma mexicanum TaxID=8296 RepID=UPI0037E710BC
MGLPGGFGLQNYQFMQAMVFAIDEINSDAYLLPNVTVGFWIYDSCDMMRRALKGILWILTGQEEPVPNFSCQQNLPLMGIMGDAGSSCSIVMARVLGLYRFPQISYFSSSPVLSDRNQFPSFFRTIPSDVFQSQGLAQLLVYFGWTWVGLLIEDNDYGQQGVQILKQELAKAGICIAFSENIILHQADRNALHIIQVIEHSTASAVVIFCSDAGLIPLIDEMVIRNVTGKTWIASEAWSTSAPLSMERYSEFLAGTIGFAIRSGVIPGFEEHLTSVNPSRSAFNGFMGKFWEEIFGCKWLDHKLAIDILDNTSALCTGDEKLEGIHNDYIFVLNARVAYNVYNAVYAIAWALHNLTFCKKSGSAFTYGSCHDKSDFKPWQKGTARLRKPRIKDEELNMLADTLVANADVVSCSDLRHPAQLKKNAIWEEVGRKVQMQKAKKHSERHNAQHQPKGQGGKVMAPDHLHQVDQGASGTTTSALPATLQPTQDEQTPAPATPDTQSTQAEDTSGMDDGTQSAAASTIGEMAASAQHIVDEEADPDNDGNAGLVHSEPVCRTSSSQVTPQDTPCRDSSEQGSPGEWSLTLHSPILNAVPPHNPPTTTQTAIRDLEGCLSRMEGRQEEMQGYVKQYLAEGETAHRVIHDSTAAVILTISSSTQQVHNGFNALGQILTRIPDSMEQRQTPDLGSQPSGSLTTPGSSRQTSPNVHFRNKGGADIFFNSNGEAGAQYDIVNWQRGPGGNLRQVTVGIYDDRAPPGQALTINTSAIIWPSDVTQVPASVCSQSCLPGFRKAVKEGEPVCCFVCVLCPPGEITNQTDSTECSKCTWDQWPNARQDRCLLKIIEFLSYDEPLGAGLAAICILCSLMPVGILGLFIYHRNTPIVKANNRSLSYLLLLSLTLCFLSSMAFIGYPTPVKCLLRQAAFGIAFTLSVSGILAKTIMVVIAFNATKPNSHLRRWVGPRLSYALICFCTHLQVLLTASWLSLSPPFSQYNIYTEPGKIIVECNEGSSLAFWCMLGYLGLLASISFLVAFLARKLPDSFNEAKFITFSMLAFLSVWLSFIPAYLSTKGKYMVAMEIFAILSSSSALVSCIFFHKCYIILFRPEMNTREYLMGRETGIRKETAQ